MWENVKLRIRFLIAEEKLSFLVKKSLSVNITALTEETKLKNLFAIESPPTGEETEPEQG